MYSNISKISAVLSIIIMTSCSTKSASSNPAVARVALWATQMGLEMLLQNLTQKDSKERGLSKESYLKMKKLHSEFSLTNTFNKALTKYQSGCTLALESTNDVSSGISELIQAWHIAINGRQREYSFKKHPWDVLLIKIGTSLTRVLHTKRPNEYSKIKKEITQKMYEILFRWQGYSIQKKFKYYPRRKIAVHNYFSPFGSKTLKVSLKSSGIISKTKYWEAKTISMLDQRYVRTAKFEYLSMLGHHIKKEEKQLELAKLIRKKIVHLLLKALENHVISTTWQNKELRDLVQRQNNVKHGIYKAWHSNGNLWISGHYYEGKKRGKWQYWTKKRKLQREVLYKNSIKKNEKLYSSDGKLHGASKSWYKNGVLRSIMTFKNGVLHGLMLKKYPDNEIKQKGTFINGKKHGMFILNKKTSKMKIESLYKNNKLQTKITQDNNSNPMKMTLEIFDVDGKRLLLRNWKVCRK